MNSRGVRSCDVDRRSRNVNTVACLLQHQPPPPQQQHLRSSSDNVSFSLNDVGVTRARSHLHVFCQARVRPLLTTDGRGGRKATPSLSPGCRPTSGICAPAGRPTGGSIRTVLGVERRGRRCVFRVGGSHVRRRRPVLQMCAG